MSFSSGGGVGGAAEALTYLIKAYDTATPVFRAFGAEVEKITKAIQASMTETNRAMVAQQRAISEGAVKQGAALDKVGKAQMTAADRSVQASKIQSDAAKRSVAASNEQAVAAQKSGAAQTRAATESEAAWGRSGSGISKTGRNILLGLTAIGAGSVDMAAKFQANTLRMQTQAGVTAKQLDQIRQGLLKMAGEVGSTPDQLANGMYHVVSSMNQVLPAAKRVSTELEIMKVAAEGAQVGHSNLEETTYALASAMNALHAGAGKAQQIMGVLNATVGSGDMTMQDLIDAYKSGLIPAANTFGLSLASVNAALAVMGDMGMRGALAGTRLRMALSLLGAPSAQAAKILTTLGLTSDQAMASTKRMSDLLQKAGVHVTMLSQDLRKPDGLQVALQDLDNHLKSNGLSADAAGAAISRAFGGGRMGSAIMLMAENTNRLGLKFGYINEKANQFGHDWQLTSETFRVQVDKALASVEAFGIKIGTVLIPYATDALHALQDTANWFTKNKWAVDTLAGAFISFSTIAIGSYFVGKIRDAIRLTKEFAGGIMGLGRWMLGMNPAGSGIAATSPTGGPATATSSIGSGGLWGINATQIRVGTMMNPLAVAVVRSTVGGTGVVGSTNGAVTAGGSAETAAATAAMRQEEQKVMASLDQVASKTEATVAASMRAPAGGFMGYGGGQLMNAGAREAAAVQAGVASTLELKAAEEKIAQSQLQLSGTLDQENATLLGSRAEAQMMARAMGQTAQELSLFDGVVVKATEATAVMGEQMSLGGIANIPKINSPMPIGAAAGSNIERQMQAEMAAQEAAMLASKEKSAGGGALAGIRGAAGTAMEGLMRGGMVAMMGTLISQMVGSAVGGKTGGTISTIGTTASLGAAIGTAIEPGIGTAIGGALGGLVGAVDKLSQTISAGQHVAQDVTKGGFGGPQLQQQVGTALTQAQHIIAQVKMGPSKEGTAGWVESTFLNAMGVGPDHVAHIPLDMDIKLLKAKLSPGDFQKLTGLWFQAGTDVARQLEKGWNQYKFQSEPTMFTQLRAKISQLPPMAQAKAIESAIAFAAGLEKSGKLPKHSADMMLAQVEQVFPGFQQYLGLSAQASVATFTKQFDFSQAEDNLKKSMDNMRGDFPQVTAAMDNTAGDAQAKSAAMIKALKGVASDGSAPMRKQALADIAQLQAGADKDFSLLAQEAGTNTKSMRDAVSTNTAQAFQVGSTNFINLAKNIGAAVGAGAEANAKGLQNITDEVNAALKGMGSTQLLSAATVKALTPAQLAAVVTGQVSPGAAASPHRHGGQVTTPTIMVGEEGPHHPEYVLATNPAYRSRNQQLWARAGKDLGIPGYATGGYVFPFGPGASWGRTDQGVDFGGSGPIGAIGNATVTYSNPSDGWYSPAPAFMVYRLNDGPDSGKYIYVAEHITNMAPGNTTVRAGQAIAQMTDGIEMGWAAGPSGHQLASVVGGVDPNTHYSAVGQDFDNFLHGLAHGVITGGGFGAVNVPKLPVPTVGGKGAFTNLVRAALTKVTSAANAYIQAHAPVGLGSAFGLAGAGSRPGTVPGPLVTASDFGGHNDPTAFNRPTASGAIANDTLWGFAELSNPPNSHNWSALGGLPMGTNINVSYGGHTVTVPKVDVGAGGSALPPATVRAIDLTYAANQALGAPGLENVTWSMASGTGNVPVTTRRQTGGMMPPSYAGAFQHGGAIVASNPTLAMFGDAGEELAVFIPTSQLNNPNSPLNMQSMNSPAYPGASVGRGPGGRFDHLSGHVSAHHHHSSVVGSPITGSGGVTQHTKHFSWGYNPLTDRVEFHDTATWQKIRAEAAKQRHDAVEVKKKFDAYMAKTVQDVLVLSGLRFDLGEFDITRKEAEKLGLVGGGSISLLANFNKLKINAFRKIETALTQGLAVLTPGEQERAANRMAQEMTHKGPDAVLFAKLRGLEEILYGRTHRPAPTGGVSITGPVPEHSTEPVGHDLSDAGIRARIRAIGERIANSRTAQLLSKIITVAEKSVVGEFGFQQQIFQRSADVAALLENVAPGTSLKALGLSKLALKSVGLTAKSARALIAAGSGPAAYAEQIKELTHKEIPAYQHDAERLKRLYHDALMAHNKKLQESLLAQLAAVTQAQIKAYGDLQAAQIAKVDAIVSKYTTKATNIQSTADILSTIENLTPGTSLAALGLTPKLLRQLGLNPKHARALEGSSLAAIQELESQQGGHLTAAQIKLAQSGVAAENAQLRKERTADITAVKKLEDELPHLKGKGKVEAENQIRSLLQAILGLTDTMNGNSKAVKALTAATTKSTDTTGQMTGTVGFSYNSQEYVAGGRMSSDSPSNVSLGM